MTERERRLARSSIATSVAVVAVLESLGISQGDKRYNESLELFAKTFAETLLKDDEIDRLGEKLVKEHKMYYE